MSIVLHDRKPDLKIISMKNQKDTPRKGTFPSICDKEIIHKMDTAAGLEPASSPPVYASVTRHTRRKQGALPKVQKPKYRKAGMTNRRI